MRHSWSLASLFHLARGNAFFFFALFLSGFVLICVHSVGSTDRVSIFSLSLLSFFFLLFIFLCLSGSQ